MARINDELLSDETLLVRRILPVWLKIEDDGTIRPQSIAFVDRHTGEVSVFVKELKNLDSLMDEYPLDSFVEFRAGVPRSEGCIVARTPEVADLAHRVICHDSGRGLRRAAKQISKNFAWLRLIPPVT